MEYILIGEIVNTFGIKGELKIRSYSDFDDERYVKGNKLFIEYKNEYVSVIVDTYRVHKGFNIVSFKDLKNINLVEKYKTCKIYIDRDDIEDLDDGSYYRFEIIGLNVYDEDNNYLGKVDSFVDTLANSNLRVKNDNNEFLVPYVDAFIKDINLEEEKIIIHVIEGLL